MTNKDRVYVIGLTPLNLLQIQYSYEYCRDGYVKVINRVMHGVMNLRYATQIPHMEDAKEILKIIKDNKNSIHFLNSSIFESVIEGDDIDVDKLHIYEVNISLEKEVM
jgi:hypothetical protein